VRRSGIPGIIGSAGLGALERLHLGLLVHAQHHGRLGRVQVEPDDVVELVDEQRVGGELEVVDQVRLDLELAPDLTDRGLRQSRPLSHLRSRPVGCVGRRCLQRRDDHFLDLIDTDRRGPARARFVEQTVQAVLQEPGTPLAHRHPVTPELLGDRGVRPTLGTRQDNLRPQRQ
jgi:hypothetical protein